MTAAIIRVLGVLLAFSNLQAQTTNWIAPPGSADWFTNTNWDSGVPGPSSIATIANGGTADINGSLGQVDSLTIGTANGSSSGKQFAYALELLQESARKKPLNATCLYYLGMCHWQLKEKSQSQMSCKRALAAGLQEPLLTDAKGALAELRRE